MGRSVRTYNVSAEYSTRIIFWLFWQNKLSGSKICVGRNAEIAIFRQKCHYFGRNKVLSAEMSIFRQKDYSFVALLARAALVLHSARREQCGARCSSCFTQHWQHSIEISFWSDKSVRKVKIWICLTRRRGPQKDPHLHPRQVPRLPHTNWGYLQFRSNITILAEPWLFRQIPICFGLNRSLSAEIRLFWLNILFRPNFCS